MLQEPEGVGPHVLVNPQVLDWRGHLSQASWAMSLTPCGPGRTLSFSGPVSLALQEGLGMLSPPGSQYSLEKLGYGVWPGQPHFPPSQPPTLIHDPEAEAPGC